MLNLEKEIPRPAKLAFWPLIDLCAIGLFFALFSSKFVMAPGITLNLPAVGDPSAAIAPVFEVVSVSEVNGEEMIFYRDNVSRLPAFAALFERRGRPPENATLLVKADARVSMQTLSELADVAIKAGYSKVQLAAENRQEAESAFSER